MEQATRKMQPDVYEEASEALEGAAEKSRQEIVAPIFSTPDATRKELGQHVVAALENLEAAVKRDTQPVFEKARRQGFRIDPAAIRAAAAAELARDKAAAEGTLKAGERAYLEKLVRVDVEAKPLILGADGKPLVMTAVEYEFPLDSPGGVLDFISGNKAKMREITAEGAPSPAYEAILSKINEAAEDAYEMAARKSGAGGMYDQLTKARDRYRDMMSTVYDKAMVRAMKAEPEKVGELIAAKGNVSQIEELDRMFALAEKEKAIDGLERALLRNEIVKGFLGRQVTSLDQAATFTERLASDPQLARTYKALMRDPATKGTQDLMAMLERQAQIVLRDEPARANAQLLRFGSPAGAGTAGFWMGGWPGLIYGATLGWNVGKIAKMIALSQTKGSGVLPKDLAHALRATTPGFAGGRSTIEVLKRLNEAAKANGLGELIEVIPPQQPQQEQ
jgi:hypothetical protein